MLVGMVDAWMEIDGNDDIRCAILTGAGGTFCAGMDLKSMSGPGTESVQQRMADDPDLHWKALLRHYSLKKPLIAAVEGWAVAGGTEILQATDIRVAGESAKFGVFEARRGLFPLGGSTVRLRRQIPFTVAMDLLLTAREVSAQEAKEIGLIGRVVPDGTALENALEIAEVIAANGPLAVEAIKASVKATEGIPEEQALSHRARVRVADLRHRGRQGGPEGLRREAARQLPTPVSNLFEDDAPPGDLRRRLAAALRPIITMNVAAELDDVALTEAAEAIEAIAERLTAQAGPKRTRSQPDLARAAQDFFPTSPVIGLANPVAPPVRVGGGRRATTAARRSAAWPTSASPMRDRPPACTAGSSPSCSTRCSVRPTSWPARRP